MTSITPLRSIALLAAFLLLSGQGWAAPVEVVPRDLRGAIQPQVAADPSGGIHLTFGKGNAVYYTHSQDGREFSNPVKVGELDRLALGLRRGPRITAANGKVAIAAISHGDGNLHVWTSQDGGANWKAGPMINDREKSAREGLHAIAGDGTGFVFAVWLDDRNGGKQVWGASSVDGGLTWSPNVAIYASPDGHVCECCHPSVAVDSQGRVAVMWRNWLGGARDFYTAVSEDRGKTFGAAQKAGEGTWKINACPMDGGGIAISAAGKPVTVWKREKAIFVDESGGTEERLSAAGAQPVVIANGGNVSVIWENAGRLTIARREGGNPQVIAEHGKMAAAAPLPDGRTVVAWEETGDGGTTIMSEILP